MGSVTLHFGPHTQIRRSPVYIRESPSFLGNTLDYWPVSHQRIIAPHVYSLLLFSENPRKSGKNKN